MNTIIARFKDKEGHKKIVVIEKTEKGNIQVGKFEITKEFDPESMHPDWEEIEFRTESTKRARK